MKVEIEYCGAWGYEPRARAARDVILSKSPAAQVDLIRGSNGVFEITVDGKLRFSKKQTGRFPTDAEVTEAAA